MAFGISVVVLVAIALVLQSISHAKSVRGEWMREMVGGSPRFTWCVGAACQGLVFPGAILASFVSFNGTGNEWLLGQWTADESSAYCMWFHCIMLAYFCKDFLFPMTTIIWVHHIVCGIAVWLSLNGNLQGGHNAFALGTVLMEFGSGANSWMHILPKPSKQAVDAFLVVMTLSNVSSVGCSLYWAVASEQTPHIIRCVFIAIATPVAAVRQRDAAALGKELLERDSAGEGAAGKKAG